jgi:hypothetical protein
MRAAAGGGNPPFTIASYHSTMNTPHKVRTTLMSLEAAAAAARGGFACMFSTSDEYERALITERRAQGRYDPPRNHWPAVMFVGCVFLVIGTVLLLS